jgi:hypothetical protein
MQWELRIAGNRDKTDTREDFPLHTRLSSNSRLSFIHPLSLFPLQTDISFLGA